MKPAATLPELLQTGRDDATALSTPGGVPLTYAALRAQIHRIGTELAGFGIAPNDRVAIVLDNGPDMAAAFLAIACSARAAPLNPGYRAEEFEFYLTDLRARLLVTGASADSPAVAVATRAWAFRSPAWCRNRPRVREAFRLEVPRAARPRRPARFGQRCRTGPAYLGDDFAAQDRPLESPEPHDLGAKRRDDAGADTSDRGFVIMPLFHIHGLVAGAPRARCRSGAKYAARPGSTRSSSFPGSPR